MEFIAHSISWPGKEGPSLGKNLAFKSLWEILKEQHPFKLGKFSMIL
jgi:hypothetical protein